MPKVDKVLEAEESIQTIASELKKMKTAADLMDAAQKKVDAVISSSTEIIEKTSVFVKEGTKIVDQIGEYNVKEDIEKLSDSISGMDEKIKDIPRNISDNHKEIKTYISEKSTANKEVLLGLSKQIDGKIEKTKIQLTKKNNISILLSSVNIVILILIILKLFEVI